MPTIERIKRASATKSRSDTASIEFAALDVNPRFLAVTSGDKGSDEPASAPEPSGLTRARSSQS